MNRKPLFIPLKTEYFNAFKSGEKIEELRKYGNRWHEGTCYRGREVVLSKGYGNHERLKGVIGSVVVSPAYRFTSSHKKDIKDVYGTLDVNIICISIKNLTPVEKGKVDGGGT